MHYVLLLHVLDPPHQLPEDDPGLFLAQIAPLLQQRRQVKTVRVLLHHVDLLRRLDRLKVANRVVTLNHAMYLDLLEDQLEVFLAKTLRVKDLARVNRLACVDSGADGLLAHSPAFIVENVARELGLAHGTELPLAYHLVIEDDIAIYFAHFWGALGEAGMTGGACLGPGFDERYFEPACLALVGISQLLGCLHHLFSYLFALILTEFVAIYIFNIKQ